MTETSRKAQKGPAFSRAFLLACWLDYLFLVDFLAEDFFFADFFADDFFAAAFLAGAFFAAFLVAFLTANCFPLEGFELRCFFAAFFADLFTAGLAETFFALRAGRALARFFGEAMEAAALAGRFAADFFLATDFFFAVGFFTAGVTRATGRLTGADERLSVTGAGTLDAASSPAR